MLCKLLEVAFVLCMSKEPGFKEVECMKMSETTFCIEDKQDKQCIQDTAEEFMYGGRYNEKYLVDWINASCKEFLRGRR